MALNLIEEEEEEEGMDVVECTGLDPPSHQKTKKKQNGLDLICCICILFCIFH